MSRLGRRRAKRRVYFRPLYAVIILVALLFAGAVYLFVTDTFGLTSKVRSYFSSGPPELFTEEGLRIIETDYTIAEAGTVLEDTLIYGNLYITESVGEGSVTLSNVIVEGAVFVSGGGLKTINITDCTLPDLLVNRPGGRVRLVAKGSTAVERVSLESGARLINKAAPESGGFKKLEVVTREKLELSGSFETIEFLVKEAFAELDSDELSELIVGKTGSGSTLKFKDGMVIKRLFAGGSPVLLGRPGVEEAYYSAAGTTALNGYFNKVRITAEAGLFNLTNESTFAEVVLAKDAFNNEFYLEEEATVAHFELNEAAVIRGTGVIELVIVNAAGSTMEQVPLDLDFGEEDLSINIAGHDISSSLMLKALLEHGDPYYYEATTEPDPAPAPEPEPEPQPAPAPKPEEPEPAPEPAEPEEPKEPTGDALIKDFIVGDEELTVGYKLVVVTLKVDDPGNYTVSVAGTRLEFYDGEEKFFRGEVPAKDALREKVKVSRK